jgi:hypothetical protein
MASYAYTFTSGDTVTPTKLNDARTVSDIVNADIADSAINNAKVASDAAIAGTKVAPNFGSQNIQTTGNLAFGGTGNRITGDFSNATISSRAMVQSSTTNGATNLYVIPNGTASAAAVSAASSSSPDNASIIQMVVDGSTPLARISSARTGTGTFLPLAFTTSDTERMRIDASGNVGIGGAPASKFDVHGNAVIARVFDSRATTDSSSTFAAQNGNGVILNLSTFNNFGVVNCVSDHRLELRTNNTTRVDVKTTGQVRFIPLSSDPAGAETGDVYYNSATNKLKVYNGTSWVDLH